MYTTRFCEPLLWQRLLGARKYCLSDLTQTTVFQRHLQISLTLRRSEINRDEKA